MRSFEDSLNAHKSELTEALIVFGEHKRVGKALAELETQRPEFYKFYKDGQESRQNEVDELQKRVDAAFRVLSQLNDLDDEAHKRWKREACMFSQGESNAYEHSVRLLEQALKGGNK